MFSDMLVYLRKRQKMTQVELAQKLGVSRSTVGMYENGRREPDFETLEAIADIFNVSMSVLIDSPNSKTRPQLGDGLDDADMQIMEYLKRLGPDHKRFLLAQLQTLLKDQEDHAKT